MERSSSKHGPRQDEQLKHETEPLERGTPQRPHVEEWRQVEPAEDLPAERVPGGADHDIELRAELARVLTRDVFPAGQDELASRLADTDVPSELVTRVAELPRRRFADVHEVMVALGINAPEQRDR
jgi:hypothetical protein